ncbi:neprilysin-1-like [Dermacentor silvarum]|uniref:neprilysin-1-like n=1 Tax=Dermacentor silvarum TaxID=543639 RepID=UPI002101ADDA|nr:neprilysin-1-like [Dermacentor silvarum]XP_049515258.1 neprilysin-1-like [Dermacentor silvarum]XP_049515259.1 neprilysin-1-like [Dermacentor silvarum]XP_049515260.1 neprilysin-1-like [Dermacentor silvarum]
MNFKTILISVWIWLPALATAYDTDSDTFLVCNSSECIQRAKLINDSLNTSIDPCTDFYSYVCGRWESTHPLPSGAGSYDVYQEIRKDIPEMLSYILGNRTLVETNQTAIDKVVIMYNACLALPDSSADLKKVLDGSGFNAWPILPEENVFNSSNCSDLLQHMSISSILDLRVTNMKIHASDPAYPYAMTIGPMTVQEEVKTVKNIGEVINNTIKLLNPEINSSMLDHLTKQMVEFCKKLSDITVEGYHDTSSINYLESKYPNIPLSVLLKKEFGKANITWSDTQVSVYFPYYSKLNESFSHCQPEHPL